MLLRKMFYLLPDTGGGNGGSDAAPGGNTEGKADEAEAMRKELETLRKEKAEREKKDAEEREAKLSEEEKAKAQIEKEREAVLSDYRTMQLQAAGLDAEYAALITGSTTDEIKASGDLLKKLISKVKAETEAAVKKGLSRTKAPGSGDDRGTTTDEEYYSSILKGGN